MIDRPQRSELPPEIEAIIAKVLLEAGLDFVDGREEVEVELRAHFEDGLSVGVSLVELIERFGDPAVAGRRIASTRPRAASRERGGRSSWWLSATEWWAEIRRGARRLRRAPGFSAIVVLTLGLGVGANTAIFTVLNAVVLQDLPYPEPDRLVRVYEGRIQDPDMLGFLRAPIFAEYRRWSEVFESLGAIYTYREIGADLTDGDVPRRVTVLRVSSGYFETLGVIPQVGRTFLEEESFGPGESRGSTDLVAAVAMISNALWSGQFAGAPDVVGRTIRLDGSPFEVVGVLPAGFASPFGAQGDVWIPQDLRMGGSNSFGNSYLSAVGRLRSDVPLAVARARAEELSRGFGEAQPEASNQVPRLVPLQEDVVGPVRGRMLWILSAAAALVLLTACVNVANLLFARGLSQDRSLALRSALGSGRARLVAGILTENGLLALLGGLAGVVMGWMGLRVLVSFGPDVLPLVADLRMGKAVFTFALAITVTALMIFGLAPALRLSRTAPSDVLRAGDRSSTAGRVGRRVRDVLVVIQVASALMLVAGAGLLARSFSALADVPLGVDPRGVLTFEVHLPDARYPDGALRHAFHERLQARLSELAGVEAVGATSWLPVSGRYHEWGFSWDSQKADGSDDAEWNPSDVRIIAGDYFTAMGIELLRGRAPADIDYAAEPVMWVNERIVEEVFGANDPVGRQVWMNGAVRRVVGVVDDVPYGPRGEISRKLYLPHAQYNADRNWALIQTVRTRGDVSTLAESVRTELGRLDGQLVLYRPQSFQDVLTSVRSQDRFATVLMGTLATLALLLSLLGTYGVLAGSVASRRREIGIRMALGADARRVRMMVLRYAAAITIPGVVLGVVGAWAASRWIGTLLYGVEPGDPLAYAAAVVVFLCVGLFSGWLPAARATRVDTVQVLSAE